MVKRVSHGPLCNGVSDRLVNDNCSTCEQLDWLLFVAADAPIFFEDSRRSKVILSHV
jgi:hypothetical protein